MSIMRNIFIAALVFTVFIGGCGKKEDAPKKEEAAQLLPPGHPATEGAPQAIMPTKHPEVTATQKYDIRLPKDILAKWKDVEVEVNDATTGGKDAFKVKVGSVVNMKVKGYSFKVEAFVPDYAIFEDYIGSRSDKPNNPAILVTILEGGKSVAKGWVFKKKEFQSFNSLKHSRFSVTLLTPAT